MSEEILLITRLVTLNKGNQALSVAWLKMLERAFPTASIRALERRPRHLLQFTLRELSNLRDPFEAFDEIATKLARLAPGPSVAGTAPRNPHIRLDETVAPPVKLLKLRQRLNLRGRLAQIGRYRKAYERRLSAMQRAKLVVVNPAGEFFPREPGAAFYHLLDAHGAQKLGVATAVVNHTMDITDPTLRKLIPTIYKTLDLVGFRDAKSIAAFREMGGKLDNVLVTPDLALTIERGGDADARRSGTVAVAINVPEATAGGYLQDWHDVVAGLIANGSRVVLVSNEVPADMPFYTELARRHGVQIEGAGLDYDRYARLLGSFDCVVTSRMHTGVLAMIGGTPVVPVEGSSFKITGLFQELGLTTPVIRPGVTAWPAKVIEQVTAMRGQRETTATETEAQLSRVRNAINSTLVPRLQAATARTQ
jgi:polysaccharide pyruvyl transferase WcaK-like protein